MARSCALLPQQVRFVASGQECNDLRPHEAIGMRTPSEIWTPSARPIPTTLPEPEYERHMQVRAVRHTEEMKVRGHTWFLSAMLAGERVALEEAEDGIWSRYMYKTELSRLDARQDHLIPAGRSNRLRS